MVNALPVVFAALQQSFATLPAQPAIWVVESLLVQTEQIVNRCDNHVDASERYAEVRTELLQARSALVSRDVDLAVASLGEALTKLLQY